MHQDTYILRAADEALDAYGIRDYALDEVGSMRFDTYLTVKFQCDTAAGRHLLSAHLLDGGADAGAAAAFFASQLLWLEALDGYDGLRVQTPARNGGGELVTAVADAPDLLLTLVDWVPGELFENEDESPLTPAQAYALGALQARLHRHGEEWTPPRGFTRPVHPVCQLEATLARLQPARDDGRIAETDFAVVRAVAARAAAHLADCGRGRGSWGLLHGDFTAGNCVFDGGRLAPIDFDWCCEGNYLGDTARCLLLHEADPQVTDRLLAGYQSVRQLREGWFESLETLTLATVLWTWSDAVDRRTDFAEIPAFAAREFAQYLGGESFLSAAERTWL